MTKARDHGADIADASGVLIFLAQVDDAVKVGFPIKQRCPGNLLEHRAADASGSLITDAGKRLEIVWVKAQCKKGDDIQHNIVLFKPRFVFPNIKIDVVALQNIHHRDGGQVVAVEDGGGARLFEVGIDCRVILVGKIVQYL